MGLSCFKCENCEEMFTEYNEDRISCECGKYWCDEDCAEESGFKEAKCKRGFELHSDDCNLLNEHKCCWECSNFEDASCGYCRKEIYSLDDIKDDVIEFLEENEIESVDDMKNKKDMVKKCYTFMESLVEKINRNVEEE